MRVTFASESVTEGHPDKVCDKISDSVLDAALTLDPRARVACETMVSEDLIVITGEVSDVVLNRLDIAAIARQAIRDIGYSMDNIGFVLTPVRSKYTSNHRARIFPKASRQGRGCLKSRAPATRA